MSGRDASAGSGSDSSRYSARRRFAWGTGLSTKLLVLTAIFVMLAEIFIYLPSIARYRQVFLENVLSDAHLATLALEAAPDGMVSRKLSRSLLSHARALAIVHRHADGSRHAMTAGMPPKVSKRGSLGNPDFLRLIWASLVGFLLFAEVPDARSWLGGAAIFASATYIAFRESRLARSRQDRDASTDT